MTLIITLDILDMKMESQKEFNEDNHNTVEHLLCMRHCSKCYLILTTFLRKTETQRVTNTVSWFSARKGCARYLHTLHDCRRMKPYCPNILQRNDYILGGYYSGRLWKMIKEEARPKTKIFQEQRLEIIRNYIQEAACSEYKAEWINSINIEAREFGRGKLLAWLPGLYFHQAGGNVHEE